MTVQTEDNGTLELRVRPVGASALGLLTPFRYDNADKFNTRKVAQRRAETSMRRWRDNYPQFRDAEFFIKEA